MSAVYARVFETDGARFSREEVEAALLRVWSDVQAATAGDRYDGVTGEAGFWRDFLGRVRGLLDGGSVTDRALSRLAEHFRDPGNWAIYDDVLPAIEDLAARGLKLAVVSNWDSQLPGLLEKLGLARHFPVISVSAIEETGKPEAEIFRRTCSRLGVSPAEALHVGDSVRDDLEGARGAGLSALLIDRDKRHGAIPERIDSLLEIASRL